MASTNPASGFDNYDWDTDEKWQLHLKSIEITDPSDPKKIMERLKRRHYKKNVDPNFDDSFPSVHPTISPDRTESKANNSTPNPTTTPTSTPAPTQAVPRPPPAQNATTSATAQNIWFIANFSLVFNAVMFLIPFFFDAEVSYRRAMYSGLIAYAVCLYQYFGVGSSGTPGPQAKDNVYYLMYCALFLNIQPVLVALGPLTMYSFFNVIQHPLVGRLPGPVSSLINKARANQQQATFIAAGFEVLLGLLLVLQWVGGNAAILHIVVYWQFLNYRFHSAQPVNVVIKSYASKFEQYKYSRFMPAAVFRSYENAQVFFTRYSQYDRPSR